MPVFVRRSPRPAYQSDYRLYRTEVREDFCECCAYCLLPEIFAGGKDNFELDHYHPKSKPIGIADVNDFYNLYYSCHVCNHYKGNSWPASALETIGYKFIDLCSQEFSEHFQPEREGRWSPLTLAGKYTEERLRLNRSHLVKIRELLNDIAELKDHSYVDWSRPARDQIAAIFMNNIPKPDPN